jgi:choline/glycine/proline betaine transport protein
VAAGWPWRGDGLLLLGTALQPYEPPTFALQDPRRPVSEGTRHYRAEVYLREGGQDYDVMGWTKVQLIHDVLDQYERHRQFLDKVRS